MDKIINQYNKLIVGEHKNYDILKSIGEDNSPSYKKKIKKFMLSIIFSNYDHSYKNNNVAIFKILSDNFKYFDNQYIQRLFEFNNAIHPFFKKVLLINFNATPLNVSKAIYHYDVVEHKDDFDNKLFKSLLYNKNFEASKEDLKILIESNKDFYALFEYVNKINCKYKIEDLVSLYADSPSDKETAYNMAFRNILEFSDNSNEIISIYNLTKTSTYNDNKYHVLIKNRNLDPQHKLILLDLLADKNNNIELLKQTYVENTENLFLLLHLPDIISQEEIIAKLIENNAVLDILINDNICFDILNNIELIPFTDKVIDSLDEFQFDKFIESLVNEDKSKYSYNPNVVKFIRERKNEFQSYSLFILNNEEISKIIENNIMSNLSKENMNVLINNEAFIPKKLDALHKIQNEQTSLLFNIEKFNDVLLNKRLTSSELSLIINETNNLYTELSGINGMEQHIQQIQEIILFSNPILIDDKFLYKNMFAPKQIRQNITDYMNFDENTRMKLTMNNFKLNEAQPSIFIYKVHELMNQYVLNNKTFDFIDADTRLDDILNIYILNTNQNGTAKQNPNVDINKLLEHKENKKYFYALTCNKNIHSKDFLEILNLHQDLEIDVDNISILNDLVLNIINDTPNNIKNIDYLLLNLKENDVTLITKLLESNLSLINDLDDKLKTILNQSNNSVVLNYIEFLKNQVESVMDFS